MEERKRRDGGSSRWQSRVYNANYSYSNQFQGGCQHLPVCRESWWESDSILVVVSDGTTVYNQRGTTWHIWSAVTCRRFSLWRSYFPPAGERPLAKESGCAAEKSCDKSQQSKCAIRKTDCLWQITPDIPDRRRTMRNPRFFVESSCPVRRATPMVPAIRRPNARKATALFGNGSPTPRNLISGKRRSAGKVPPRCNTCSPNNDG